MSTDSQTQNQAKGRIRGILPALISPMHSDGSLNLPEQGRLVDWLFEQGVHGLYIGGTTGEGLLLTIPERQAIVESAIDFARGRGPILVHVGAVGTAEAIELARHAEKAGADGIAAVPPFAFGRNLAGIQAHYRAIARSCELPLYLYNIPSLTAVNLRADDVRTLMDIPTVQGLKFSDNDLFEEHRILSIEPKLDVFHGCDETLLYALMEGAVGGVGLTYNFIPKQILGIYNAFQSGDWKRANKLQLKVSAMIDELIRHCNGNIVGLAKGIMASLGFDCGQAREPNPPLAAGAVERLTRIVTDLRTIE